MSELPNKTERECKHHGLTTFARQSSLGKITYYCVQCSSARQNELRQRKKLLAIEYKGGKCCKCGYDKSPAALDFHHLDPTEKDLVKFTGVSIEKMKAELDKCILVCSNCHREIHEELRIAA